MAESENNVDWDRSPQFDVTGTVLVGLLRAPEAERLRRPGNRAQVDVEIHGRDPLARVESSLAESANLLRSIDDLRSDAERLAPEEWRQQYLDRADYAGLFLEGFEFHDDGTTRVLFDFGDLDLLILELLSDGRRTATVEH